MPVSSTESSCVKSINGGDCTLTDKTASASSSSSVDVKSITIGSRLRACSIPSSNVKR